MKNICSIVYYNVNKKIAVLSMQHETQDRVLIAYLNFLAKRKYLVFCNFRSRNSVCGAIICTAITNANGGAQHCGHNYCPLSLQTACNIPLNIIKIFVLYKFKTSLLCKADIVTCLQQK